MSPSARRDLLDPDALAALEEERDFLLRSIEDLDREHAVGDVTDEDHRTLRDDYTARAAAVIHAIEGRQAAIAEAQRPRSLARFAAISAVVLLVAGLAGFAVARMAGDRSQGQQISGGVVLSVGQQLTSCLQLSNTSERPVEVLECYDGILADHPANVEALTYRGWFLLRLDLQGMTFVEQAWPNLEDAVAIDPAYPDARVFRAIALNRLCRPDEASAELEAFDDARPLQEMVDLVEQQQLRESIDQLTELRDAVPEVAGPPAPLDIEDPASIDQCAVLSEAGVFDGLAPADEGGSE
ncbi:tetratricopeptide repeat protein [Actinomarinicola tropica]|uniref:Tetratricopeptide repeat protein n=1 Tax=Actinomarinicola tropica TaxID=2789776 RepID=A0A5Q2RJG8_9ACTN|nr:hypothetical protein [Actinomarinicola tropica]QGG94536.1 hypothetical protein GH723_05125 [Actinomarinicola tropica]